MKISGYKRIFSVVLALAALIVTVVMVHGCGVSSYPSTTDTAAGTIVITRSGVVQVGATPAQLTATLNGTDVTTSVTWSTDQPLIATVDSAGVMTGHLRSSGSGVTVTATLGADTGTLVVIVFAMAGH